MVKARIINKELLDDAIKKSGFKTSHIVKEMGISRQAFHKKRTGEYALRKSEVFVLCDLCHITDETLKNSIFSFEG